ncbi:hypothetical protein [Legionella longbeachae]|uniref:Ankyrin repeat-containing protein n=1 Tax=Legionella longbeachae serogroup 1 (strain NSW150) TaxID=661367 RepID=D3HRC2_LEGLN|nr:hypothetical protein [Legionella longbeachae]VEE01956.1 ankyrin repeat-containing protein [Legionella oakridgensis]HBD7396792.1 hypothetical protein [Legionella pneumophila]ARB91732.1 hypothetical protein A6J40_05845 [Legionella longbeachae]QIN35193.1 hypothetical protein GCS73_05875 [Legionella longbeachae]RZV28124.1 hypothetical protein EKG34_00640 [Legionella longbeachae]
MSSQGKIINAVNLCLKQKPNIDFELNQKGICAGLAALYIKYALENKTSQFFSLLDQLATLPSNYRLGTNHAIDSFIIQIDKTFRPSEYYGYEIHQGDLEKILDVRNKPLSNEFNLGLITDESCWIELFKKISRKDRSYYITSKNHAIALTLRNGKYVVYDPNYSKKIKEFDSINEVIKEIKDCFEYTENTFGLAMRVFAHPNDTKESYPTHDELHQIAFAHQTNTSSSTFAALAGDVNTLNYLFKENHIDLSSLAKEYLRPEFNDLLLQQPKSPGIKNALLQGVRATFYTGTHKETEKLIHYYLKTYTTFEEQNELKETIQKQFSEPLPDLMKKKADYSNLMKILNQFSLPDHPGYQTNYNHLQLLTFIHQESNSQLIHLFLSKLSPEQLIKQIQHAAIANQHHILSLLFAHLKNTQIDPETFPSIFNKEVINKIDATTLSKLLGMGFIVNTQEPDLLFLCIQRKDKSIFEAYARAWSEQTNHPENWRHIDKHEYSLIDLRTSIGSASLLDTLIFLRKNEHIKNAWRAEVPEEIIKSGLTLAILNDNQEMCIFLQEKLKDPLDIDTLEFLYKKGLEENNLTILSTLTQLNFNVLRVTQDIRALLMLCYDYDDYSIIENCFEQASPKIKKLILEYSLMWSLTPVINICIQKEPQLFNGYLNESMQNPPKLAKLNQTIVLLPPDTLSLKGDEQKQKNQIKEWCKKKLFHLAETICIKITWNKEELNEFLNELIHDKNENGIVLLLKTYPQLKENPELNVLLAQNNLLKPLDYLLAHGGIIKSDLIEQIFTSALLQNQKNLVARFLTQGLITPTTKLKQPLAKLLQDAIEKGMDSLEPFIQSKLDFALDYKKLFLFSCAQKKEKIANQILARELILTDHERQCAIHQLFGEQPPSDWFEKVYVNGYGRLYQLLLKADIQHPRIPLLNSIKNPEHDPAFQQTELYLNPLKRAIKEKNEPIFNSLFTQSELPDTPDHEVLLFLKDPLLFPRVIHLIAKKYGLDKLLTEALKYNEWAVVAHLIEKQQLNDLNSDLQQLILKHKQEIVSAYLEHLESHYEKMDVRPQLFKLYTNINALAQLAIPYQEAIQKTLERIELNMLHQQLDLNNQIYRYTFSHLPFKRALEEIGNVFAECQKIIREKQIDLEQSIENPEIVNALALLKTIMSGHDITPDYLSDENADLLEKLIENSRFKEICQLELRLYFLLKNIQKPLSEQSQTNQNDFNTAIKTLHNCLGQKKLPISFVIPEIQTHLKNYRHKIQPPKPIEEIDRHPTLQQDTNSCLNIQKEKCIQSLNHYLNHRDQTLSYFSYFFDYYRGKTRAQHYKNLIKSAQSERDLYLIEYAIFANNNGTQLKRDMLAKLNYKELNEAKNSLKSLICKSYSKHELKQLDKVIDSINQKVNTNDRTATAYLFHDELAYLQKIDNPQQTFGKHSFFQAKKQEQFGFWQWIASWFGYISFSEKEHMDVKAKF